MWPAKYSRGSWLDMKVTWTNPWLRTWPSDGFIAEKRYCAAVLFKPRPTQGPKKARKPKWPRLARCAPTLCEGHRGPPPPKGTGKGYISNWSRWPRGLVMLKAWATFLDIFVWYFLTCCWAIRSGGNKTNLFWSCWLRDCWRVHQRIFTQSQLYDCKSMVESS